MMRLRLAVRELGRSWRKLLLPSLAIGAAVAGHSAVGHFSAQVREAMDDEARATAGADLEVDSSRPLTESERAGMLAALPEGTRSTSTRDFLSMARDPETGRTRLVEVRVVGPGFPFYGGLQVEPPQGIDILRDAAEPRILAQPEILPQLGVRPGGRISLGKRTFSLSGIVRKEPGPGGSAFALGPRVWIADTRLEPTGLDQTGSRIRYRELFALTPIEWPKLEDIKKTLESRFTDPLLRVRTFHESNPQLRAFYDRLSDFLGVLSLFGFLLAGIGVMSATRAHLRSRAPLIAILRTLGASTEDVLWIFLLQILLLGAIGSAIGVLTGAFLSRALPEMARGIVEIPVARAGLHALPFARSFALGTAATLLFALIALVELPSIKPLRLLRAEENIGAPGLERSLAILATGLFLAGVAWAETGSLALGIGIAGGAALFGVVVFGLFFGALTLGRRFSGGLGALPFPVRYGLRNVGRTRSVSALNLTVLSVGAVMLTSISVLRSGMLRELSGAQSDSRPELFLIDIGDDQKAGVEKLLSRLGPLQVTWSKLIRARMTAVNGQAVTRETGDENRSREYNLSERPELYPTESVVKGNFWNGPAKPGDPAEVSLVDSFAERLDAHLGDTLDFELQGVPISARVTSLRRVKWTTFQPNFFVLFRPGTLEGAPFNWIASVARAKGNLKVSAQEAIVREFPTISAIDIDEAGQRLLAVAFKIESVIRFLSLFALAAGLLVTGMIALENAQARSAETALLKVLGGGRRDLLLATLSEFLLLGTLSSLGGALGALALGQFVLKSRFGIEPTLASSGTLTLLVALALAVTLTGIAASLRFLRIRPVDILRQPV